MIAEAGEPKQVRSIYQCIAATVPLFGILAYLLYKVALGEVVPDDGNSNNAVGDDAYAYNNNVYDADDQNVEYLDLKELLVVFIGILYLSFSLFVYVAVFIPKRKQLFKTYANTGVLVFGDVIEKDNTDSSGVNRFCDAVRCRKPTYLDCTYTVPGTFWENEIVNGEQQRELESGLAAAAPTGPVRYRKRIKTQFPWYRERIPFLVLPGKPKSGMPRSDVELDVSNHDNHNTRGLAYVSLFWMIFSFCGALFTTLRFQDYYDEDDDVSGIETGSIWNLFWLSIGLFIPIVLGYNWFQFYLYRRFMVHSGVKINEDTQRNVPSSPADVVQSGTQSEDFPNGESAYVAIS